MTGTRRRWIGCGLALAVLVCALTACLWGPATRTRRAAAAGPIVLGAPAGFMPVSATAYQATENKLGRPLAAMRLYARWDTPFPDGAATWAKTNGRRVLLSVGSVTTAGAPVLYKDIAAAAPGSALYSRMTTWATALKAYGVPVYFTFNHEPETVGSTSRGTAAEYVAAWKKFRQVIRAEASNVSFLFIGTAYGFRSDSPHPVVPYYPGDNYVDAIGADAYNWLACRPGISNKWTSLADLLSGFVAFGRQHPSKPPWVTEFASTEDPATPGRKAAWVADAQKLFKTTYTNFAGVLMWYPVGTDTCQFRIDSSPGGLTAYQTLGADPYYKAGLPAG